MSLSCLLCEKFEKLFGRLDRVKKTADKAVSHLAALGRKVDVLGRKVGEGRTGTEEAQRERAAPAPAPRSGQGLVQGQGSKDDPAGVDGQFAG